MWVASACCCEVHGRSLHRLTGQNSNSAGRSSRVKTYSWGVAHANIFCRAHWRGRVPPEGWGKHSERRACLYGGKCTLDILTAVGTVIAVNRATLHSLNYSGWYSESTSAVFLRALGGGECTSKEKRINYSSSSLTSGGLSQNSHLSPLLFPSSVSWEACYCAVQYSLSILKFPTHWAHFKCSDEEKRREVFQKEFYSSKSYDKNLHIFNGLEISPIHCCLWSWRSALWVKQESILELYSTFISRLKFKF